MSKPAHAQATDRGRYYLHPQTGERWPSITNVLDTAVNKPALVPWAAKVTAEYAMANLPMLVRRSLRDRDGALKDTKAQVRYVKDTAADLGTRVHEHAEAHVLGKPIEADPEVEPYARQLVRFFRDWRVDFDRDIEAVEATVINRTFGYAGTGDLWLWLRVAPDGTHTPRKRHLWLIDYKSSATRPATSVYPEHGMQVAAVAGGEKLLLADGTEIDPPAPVAATAVLNLRTHDYALIPTPADRGAAFSAFVAALETTRYLHGIDGKPTPLPAPQAPTNSTKGAA